MYCEWYEGGPTFIFSPKIASFSKELTELFIFSHLFKRTLKKKIMYLLLCGSTFLLCGVLLIYSCVAVTVLLIQAALAEGNVSIVVHFRNILFFLNININGLNFKLSLSKLEFSSCTEQWQGFAACSVSGGQHRLDACYILNIFS